MSFPTVTTGNLVRNPLALLPAKGTASQIPELANAVPAATTNNALSSLPMQSLDAFGTFAGVGEAPFTSSLQSALQGKITSPQLKTPGLSPISQTAIALDPTSLTPLLLQTLNSEDLSNPSGDIPFITPYQLGLQAINALTPQVQTPSQANLAQMNVSLPDAAQNQDSTAAVSPDLSQAFNPLNTLGGAADAPTLGVADPTSSALFQSHLGALGANPFLASASLNSGLTETPTTLRVMATNAGAATGAFSEGQPLNPNSYVLNSAAREGLSPNPSPSAMSVEGVPAIYSPQGIPMAYRTRIGALLDLRG